MSKPEIDPKLEKVAHECLALRVRLLNRALTQRYDEALRPLDLRIGQFSLLLTAAREGTVVPGELCEALCMDPSTMSRNLARLEERKWIERVTAKDGRSQPFTLTKSGRALLDKAVPLWETAQAEVTQLLGEMGVALLREAAKKARG